MIVMIIAAIQTLLLGFAKLTPTYGLFMDTGSDLSSWYFQANRQEEPK